MEWFIFIAIVFLFSMMIGYMFYLLSKRWFLLISISVMTICSVIIILIFYDINKCIGDGCIGMGSVIVLVISIFAITLFSCIIRYLITRRFNK
jgi:hypothetical protein